ncbi:MAG: hypothetical protein HETSPECPRED_002305 [Heterodermia speciosa]|uniref:Fork-head domain-containing protein n=1 Tax=Heterodermia speciosa TaxID=116794 RepID=A0A8H3F156_9LECA|nr:MAG: hypothetical protein HETSPECPRED_002305 [Heterodermia speciosa]
MAGMEQEPGSEDRTSAENGTPPLDMLDTPAKEATNVLRRLYAESTTPFVGDVAMDLGEGQPFAEGSSIYPSEAQYRMDLNGLSATDAGKGTIEKTLAQGSKSDLDQYQKHIYTPRSTRSMTQPAQSYNADPELEEPPMTDAALSAEESDVPQIQAFAKLEFDDGEFYMNTYSVELGRDLQSARQAAEKVSLPARRAGSKRRKRSASSGDASHIPRKVKREHNRSHPSSVVSERGGIIAVDHSDAESLGGYHSKKPASTSSSSQQMSRKSSMLFAPHHTDYQSLAMASLMGPDALRHYDSSNPPLPAPEACPLIPIHPPVKRLSSLDGLATVPDGLNAGLVAESVGTHQTISRKHVKIAFNFEKHLFEVHILGRNGAFVDEEYCCRGDVRPLTNGSSMQIGNVSVKFLLPEVAPGETGAERNSNPNYASGMSGTSADYEEMSSVASDGGVHGNGHQASEDEEDSDTGKTSAQTSPEQKASSKAKSKGLRSKKGKLAGKVPKAEAASAPKRKGPGRPPKNGVMSKREMGLLAKQAKEEAKAAKKEADGELASGKAKTVKSSNEKPQETPSVQPNGKRKYTKRKSKVDPPQEPSETRESTEHTQSVAPEQIVPPKPPKEKKPLKPPRSPSPFIDRNSLSEEQLAKPTQSYVVLIHEALSESEKGPMSLNQIYRAIAYKYPYFKFVVTTVGWQSSIRHNLLQHEAFEKIEREGKGWMWGLKPGVSIEKEKKRRATPPPPQSHPYYPPAHMMQHQYGYYPGVPVPPPNGQAPYHPHYGPPPNGIPQYAGYPQGYYPPPPRPNGLPLPLLNAASENTSNYQSPYDSAATTEPPQPNNQRPATPPQQPNSSSHHLPEQPDVLSATPNHQLDPTQPNQSRHPPLSSSETPANMTPESRQAVDRFKSVLMSSMPDKAFGELLITSAISRVFGSQQHSSLPGRGAGIAEDPQEVMVMQALKNMIPSVVPKKDLPKPQNDAAGDIKSEPPSTDGGFTPGAIARGLLGEGGSEAETKEDGQKSSRETPPKAETSEAEHGDEVYSQEAMSSDPEKGDGTDAEEVKTSSAKDGTQSPESTAEIPAPSATS